MKFNKTQTEILERLKYADEALKEECKDFWKNIKIPWNSIVVPEVMASGKREEKAAAALVEMGELVQLTRIAFTKAYKPK